MKWEFVLGTANEEAPLAHSPLRAVFPAENQSSEESSGGGYASAHSTAMPSWSKPSTIRFSKMS